MIWLEFKLICLKKLSKGFQNSDDFEKIWDKSLKHIRFLGRTAFINILELVNGNSSFLRPFKEFNAPGSEVGPGTVATWGTAVTDEVNAPEFRYEWKRSGRSSKHITFNWNGP